MIEKVKRPEMEEAVKGYLNPPNRDKIGCLHLGDL
jgi:hypothetical protein